MVNRVINFNALAYTSLGLFILLLTLLITPQITINHSTSALSCGSAACETDFVNDIAETAVEANVTSTVSLGLASEVNIDIVPKLTGTLTEAPTTLVVATNNTTGFAVYMQSNNSDGSLKGDTSNKAIAPMTGSDFNNANNNNAWGYNINNGTYHPVPYKNLSNSTTTPIISESSPSTNGSKKYNINFGIKVDTSLPADYYTGTVTVSAVANPSAVGGLRSISYMQDMTTEVCEKTSLHYTKQLTDTRDGKKYWVAKLRDGNCWMTQNLAFDLSTSKNLNSADTDIEDHTNYVPTSTTYLASNAGQTGVSPEFTGKAGSESSSNQYSWGKWKNTVLATPILRLNCKGYSGNDNYNSIKSTDTLAEKCWSSGFIDVTDWSPTFKAKQDTIWLKNPADETAAPTGHTTLVAADNETKSYDTHYLVGNYYQYNTVTAGTGTSVGAKNASSTICPKGWTLPRSGNKSSIPNSLNTDNGSIYNLLNAYGVAKTITSASGTNTITMRDYGKRLALLNNVNGDTADYVIANNEYNIAGPPLYLTNAGYIHLSTGYLRRAGDSGYYDTISGSSASESYEVFSGDPPSVSTYVAPRYRGANVRCLAE